MEKAEIDRKEARLLTEHYQDGGIHGGFSQCDGSKKTHTDQLSIPVWKNLENWMTRKSPVNLILNTEVSIRLNLMKIDGTARISFWLTVVGTGPA